MDGRFSMVFLIINYLPIAVDEGILIIEDMQNKIFKKNKGKNAIYTIQLHIFQKNIVDTWRFLSFF